MNITEQAIKRLIKYYSLSNAAQLANKFEITQGVISNWKTRNAIGALVDTVSNKDPNALEYIFKSENINNFHNSEFNSSIAVNNGDNTNINNKSDEMTECDDFSKTLFKQLCKIYKDKNELNSILFTLIQNATKSN